MSDCPSKFLGVRLRNFLRPETYGENVRYSAPKSWSRGLECDAIVQLVIINHKIQKDRRNLISRLRVSLIQKQRYEIGKISTRKSWLATPFFLTGEGGERVPACLFFRHSTSRVSCISVCLSVWLDPEMSIRGTPVIFGVFQVNNPFCNFVRRPDRKYTQRKETILCKPCSPISRNNCFPKLLSDLYHCFYLFI